MDTDSLDLASIIGKLIESGEAAELIGRLKANAENGEAQQGGTAENNTNNEESPAVSSAIDSKQLAEKLPQVMSALAPFMEKGAFKSRGDESTQKRRNDLLLALRPYLSDGRRDMIDRIMTLSRFTGIMDLLQRDTGTKDK